MTLAEFATDFYDNSLLSVELEGISNEDSVTSDIIEYIKDCGEVLEPQLSNFKSKGLKINAYDFDDENESFDLFVTILKEDSKISKVSDNEVHDAFKKGMSFFISAAKGNLSEKSISQTEDFGELINLIKEVRPLIKHVRLFVLTNGICSTETIPEDKVEDDIFWDFELWDIERLFQQYLIKAGKQKIEIDFPREYNHRLKFLKMDDVSQYVDEYLTIMPAKILADMYGNYHQGLLEKNVRTFLQFKAKVNQGIRDTIRNEPDMFFAYNNGISATASKVDIRYEDGEMYIGRIENLQIVNGGQTTASIYATSSEKDIDLSRVFVQMKISVVKGDADIEIIVPKISKFANSQTAIKESDFSSNSQYHVLVERFSRTEWVPAFSGGKSVSKWFYERTRGQYLDERSRIFSARDIKIFDITFPKNHKFTKTDLAKYEMCWSQRPHEVSKGAEKNFKIFDLEISKENLEINSTYYHKLIGKAILFNEIDKIVLRRKLGGYKANMTAYILSWLSYKSDKKINLLAIWENQIITDVLRLFIEGMCDIVWLHINTPLKTGMNIGEWCKKPECWLELKDKFIDTDSLRDQIDQFGTNQDSGIVQQELSGNEIELINEASKYSSDEWFRLAEWDKANNMLSPFDRKLVRNFGILMSKKMGLSLKQAKNGLRIINAAIENGFSGDI